MPVNFQGLHISETFQRLVQYDTASADTRLYSAAGQELQGLILTGSLKGVATSALTSTTSSYALNAAFSDTSSYSVDAAIADVAISSSFATTSSYAVLAQNVLGSITSASYASTASFALNSSGITPTGSFTGSFTGLFKGDGTSVTGIVTSSYATVAQSVLNAPSSASFSTTASAATSITFVPPTASYALTASYASTSSYELSSSFALTSSAATSITFVLNKNQLPSATSYTDVANIFSQPQTITGALSISGNINDVGYSVTASAYKGDGANITGIVTSSYAMTSSAANSITFIPLSASYSTTSSYATVAQSVLNSPISSSYSLSASAATSITFVPPTSSYAVTAQSVINSPASSSYAITSSAATSITFILGKPQMPSVTAYTDAANIFTLGQTISGSLNISGNISNTGYSLTSSFFKGDGTAITGIVSSSYATTSSAATSITFVPATSSYATTAQSVINAPVSASFAVTSSAATSLTFIPPTASFALATLYSTLTGIPVGIHSSSNQLPTGLVSSSTQINTGSFTGSLRGVFIESSQIVTTTYTASVNDGVIIGSTTSGSFTVLLPDATNIKSGGTITLIKPYATASLIVSGSGSNQTINSLQALTLTLPSSSITIQSNGINWAIVAADFSQLPNISASLLAGSASYATSASAATSITFLPASSSYATTSSAATSITFVPTTASYANSSSAATSLTFVPITASFANTSSAATSITFVPISASYAITSSFTTNALYSNLTGIPVGIYSSSNQLPVGIFSSSAQINTGSFTGSLKGTFIESSQVVTTAYTSSINDGVIIGNTTSGSFTVLLPDAVNIKAGGIVTLIKPYATASLIVSGSGSNQTINSLQALTLTIPSSSVTIQSNGFNWSIIAADFSQLPNVSASFLAGSSSYANTSSAATSITFIPSSASYATTSSAATSLTFVPTTSSFATTSSAATSITFVPVTASYATTSSAATSITFIPISSSYATSSSYALIAQNVLGSITSASYALTASYSPGGGVTSYTQLTNIPTGIFSSSVQLPTGIISGTAQLPSNIISSSNQFTSLTAPFTGSFTGSFTGDWISSAVTARTTYTASVNDGIIYGDTTSGSFTILLPSAPPLSAGNQIIVIKPYATGSLIVSGSGSAQFINGTQAKTLSLASSSITLITSGSSWNIVSADFTQLPNVSSSLLAGSSSYATSASAATSITFVPATASFATTSSAATSLTFTPTSASYATTASWTTSYPTIYAPISGPLTQSNWYHPNLINNTAPATSVGVFNTCSFFPFIAPFTALPIKALGMSITTALPSGTGSMALYTDSGYMTPGTLLTQSSFRNTATLISLFTTASTLTLTPGKLYWLAYNNNTGSTYRNVPLAGQSAILGSSGLNPAGAFGTAPTMMLASASFWGSGSLYTQVWPATMTNSVLLPVSSAATQPLLGILFG